MMHTFLIRRALRVGELLEKQDLDTDFQAHLRARRIRSGERLQLINNTGAVYHAVCHQPGDWKFEIQSVQKIQVPNPAIHLYLAPPKGDALTECLQQATECGVASIHFVASEFCQISSKETPPWERAERVVAAAQAQCVQPFEVQVNRSWILVHETKPQNPTLWCDERLAESAQLGVQGPGIVEKVYDLWIGPEGGWSEKERQIFGGISQPLGLGSLILRTPTAVVAAVQMIRLLARLEHR
jgi:16S rRNA (uracil1498-N3)-methyltransferase